MSNATDHILKPFETCPICGSIDRKPLPTEEEFHNRYTNAIAQYAGIAQDDLLAAMHVYRCDVCSTEYCDPWVKADVAAEIYGVVMGQHRFGWWNFEQWANNETEYSTGNMKEDGLWDVLCEAVGPINSYAEINCPFAGLLTFFDRMNGMLEHEERVEISDFIVSLRETFHEAGRFKGYPHKLSRRALSPDAPRDRYIIREASSYHWGGNCVHQNTSCHTMATTLFGAKCTSFNEVQHHGIDLDVIGFYQVLDHFVNPTMILRKALEAAKVVIVLGHSDDTVIHKQHQFQFGPGFAPYLRSLGYSVQLVPNERIALDVNDVRNSRCYLISDKIELRDVEV